MKSTVPFLFSIYLVAMQPLIAESASVSTEKHDLTLEVVAEGFDSPWGMAFLPAGEILVTDRAGSLYLLRNGRKTDIEGVPEVWARGQGGLLDIELHPDYAESDNQWIYLTYASPDRRGEQGSGANTALLRARLDGNRLVNQEVIFKALPNYRSRHHFGSRVVFDQEGYLYMTIGDRGDRDKVQSFSNFRGKIIRLNDDGSIPSDNPFVGQPNHLDAIWSGGHRNPQGLAIHPQTGQLWSHEHGPRGGDELNLIRKGVNYGWPLITYGVNYSGSKITSATSRAGLEQPIVHWTPSIAPCGMTFVTSNVYPEWQGNILVGSLKFQQLHRLELNENIVTHEESLLENIGRVRAIEQGPDGYIYVAVEGPGKIYRLVPRK